MYVYIYIYILENLYKYVHIQHLLLKSTHLPALQTPQSMPRPKLPGAQPCLASQEGDGERQDVTATSTGSTGLAEEARSSMKKKNIYIYA